MVKEKESIIKQLMDGAAPYVIKIKLLTRKSKAKAKNLEERINEE
jgi:hypothetical protein